MQKLFSIVLSSIIISSSLFGAAAKPKKQRTNREKVLHATTIPIATEDIEYMLKKAQEDALEARDSKKDDNETLAKIIMHEATAQALFSLAQARAEIAQLKQNQKPLGSH